MKNGALAFLYLLSIILFCGSTGHNTASREENEIIKNTSEISSAVTVVETGNNDLQGIDNKARQTKSSSETLSKAVSKSESRVTEPAVTELASGTSSAAEMPVIATVPTYHRIQVKNIMQKPELPFGCEIVSLTIVLNHYGFGVDKMYMSDNYLKKVPFWEKNGERYGADPYEAFPGDPADPTGSGCFAAVITESAERFLADNKSDYIAVNTSGMSLNELCHNYIDKDIPVIIWITSCDLHEIVYRHTWKTKDGRTIHFPSYQHCVVLTGYDTKKKIVYIADPLVGNTTYDMKLLKKRFKELGSESVVVKKNTQ